MKSMIYLVIVKQWKAYLSLMVMIIFTCFILFLIQQRTDNVFKMPIAVQDLDQSASSKQLIKNLKKNKYVIVNELSTEDSFIDDGIKSNLSVVSMSIPQGYSDKLKTLSLRNAITLYYRDDFIGAIAQEITSKTLYEQQIPFIVKKHLEKGSQLQSDEAIYKAYKNNTPDSKIKQFSIAKAQDQSISLSAVFALLLLIATVQVVLHKNLKHNPALQRMYLFENTKKYLLMLYILSHTLLLLLMLFIVALIMQQHMSLLFYLTCVVVLIIYETVLSLLLFKVNTTSHRIFMTITFTLALVTTYLFMATGGIL